MYVCITLTCIHVIYNYTYYHRGLIKLEDIGWTIDRRKSRQKYRLVSVGLPKFFLLNEHSVQFRLFYIYWIFMTSFLKALLSYQDVKTTF